MDRQGVLAADGAPSLGTSRAHVLDLLRSAGVPTGVQDLAEQAGLHPNTARFHLEGLAGAGLAVRAPAPRATPGRPSMLYSAAPAAGPAGERRYRLLAEMLATMISGLLPEPAPAAAGAGQEWGRYLAGQPAPGQRTDAATAIARLTAILAEAGFAPGPGEAGSGRAGSGEPGRSEQIWLRRCPFQEIARQHPDVVCALHLGLMQGALEQLRAPVTASRLEPFAEPGLCIAHLAAAPASSGGTSDD
ncbi:MAG TPA: helix-turn-helix domain-containing protein [Streptosporangiaceae bacterium]